MEKSTRHQRGRLGEDRVAEYLQKKGCRILVRNFRNRTGEVDIICEAQDRLLFVEVKSWSFLGEDALEPALGAQKQHRIIQAARFFLLQHPDLRDREIRFDVVFFNPDADTVRHIEGAFEAPCPE